MPAKSTEGVGIASDRWYALGGLVAHVHPIAAGDGDVVDLVHTAAYNIRM